MIPCNLLPRAYDKLVDEDIEWLKANAPDSLEREHIIVILEFSKREYRLRGYDEAMYMTGPHHSSQKGTHHKQDTELIQQMFDALTAPYDGAKLHALQTAAIEAARKRLRNT